MKRIMKYLLCGISVMLILCGCTKNEPQYDLAGKTYYNTVDEFGNNEHSKVWFGKDGSFVLTDNFFDGYYEVSGKWSIKENVCKLDVSSSGVGDFKEILFEIKDNDNLILKTMLAGSKSDDSFTTTKPVVNNTNNNNNNNPITSTNTGDPFVDSLGEYTVFYNAHNNNNYIILMKDKSFTIVENNGVKTNEIKGLYGIDRGQYGNGDAVVMLSDFKSFKDMNNNDVHNIEFFVIDNDTLVLNEDLVVNFKNNIFTRSGKLPEGFQQDNPYISAKFTHAPNQETSDEYLPYVEFESDHTFVFVENLYAGMGEIRGTYEFKDNGLLCHVKETYSGFKGDDVKEIYFEFKDESTLILKTELCMSRVGDEFYN